MAKKRRIDLIVETFKALGGQARYEQIYSKYEEICKRENVELGEKLYKGKPVWQSVVRREVQQHSAASAAYVKTNEDLFVPMKSIGMGVWALKEFVPGGGNPSLTSARKHQQEFLSFFVDVLGFDIKSTEHLPYSYISNGKLIKGDIDVIAYYRGYTFICECKQGKKVKGDFSKWVTNNSKNLSYLTSNKMQQKHAEHKISNPDKIIYIYDTKLYKSNEYEWCQKEIDADTTGLYKKHFILNKDIRNYYKKEAQLTDRAIAANWFLHFCGINEPTKRLEVDAKRIQFNKDTTGYLFVINPKDFFEFSFVARRLPHQSSNNFYQRLLKSSRLTNIAENYLDKNYGYFPNNIVANIQDKDSFDFIENSEGSVDGKLIINKTCVCRVIDGQHRLFSYLKTSKNDGQIIVNALDTTIEDESRLFIEINDNPKTLKGVISNAVRQINEDKRSIFYKRIKYSTSSEKNKINLAGLCRALDEKRAFFKNLYISANRKNYFYYNENEFDETLYFKIGCVLSNFFKNLNDRLGDKFSNQYFEKEYIYYINIRMCLMAIQYLKIKGQNFNSKTDSKFFDDYASVIQDTNFLTPEQKALSSYGQYSTLENKYILKLRGLGHKGFAPDVKISMDKKIDFPAIEQELHEIVILLFEKLYGKNYIDHFYPSPVTKTARRKCGSKQHAQYCIPAKMTLDVLMNQKFQPDRLKGFLQVVEVGDSKFNMNQVITKNDYETEKKRVQDLGRGKKNPLAVNKVKYFDEYIAKYLFSSERQGGTIVQRHELGSSFQSLLDYRSSFKEMHAQGWKKHMTFDELFNDDNVEVYRRQSKILIHSLKNCRKKLEIDLKDYK